MSRSSSAEVASQTSANCLRTAAANGFKCCISLNSSGESLSTCRQMDTSFRYHNVPMGESCTPMRLSVRPTIWVSAWVLAASRSCSSGVSVITVSVLRRK